MERSDGAGARGASGVPGFSFRRVGHRHYPIGPVLIEGNYNWDVVLAQQAGSRPLGNTAFPDHFLSWLAKATVNRRLKVLPNAAR